MVHTLNIPEDLYARAEEIARSTAQPVEQVLLDHLKTFSMLPLDEQAELNALRYLSDDALWTIAAEQMPDAVQERMQLLMERNSLGTIAADERTELEKLAERGNRLMVRKAEAANILMDRGYEFKRQDFRRKHE